MHCKVKWYFLNSSSRDTRPKFKYIQLPLIIDSGDGFNSFILELSFSLGRSFRSRFVLQYWFTQKDHLWVHPSNFGPKFYLGISEERWIHFWILRRNHIARRSWSSRKIVWQIQMLIFIWPQFWILLWCNQNRKYNSAKAWFISYGNSAFYNM